MVTKCNTAYCREEAFLDIGWNQLMFFLHSHLKDGDKVKISNDNDLLRLLQLPLQVSMELALVCLLDHQKQFLTL